MNATKQRKEAGARGGKAAGDAKRRDMSAFQMGRGSAGRADKNYAREADRETKITSRELRGMMEVGRACDAWLREHCPELKVGGFFYGKRKSV